tara:strand:- start:115 stop:573 length:459 start_codon:yes stop_codon:yes gene_type:complete
LEQLITKKINFNQPYANMILPKIIEDPKKMNKIESVAYLFVTLMESDGKIVNEEIKTWSEMVENRWPDIDKSEVDQALNDCSYSFKNQNASQQKIFLEETFRNLKQYLDESELDNLAKDIAILIQSDGVIAIEEMGISGLLNWKLGVNVHFD